MGYFLVKTFEIFEIQSNYIILWIFIYKYLEISRNQVKTRKRHYKLGTYKFLQKNNKI